MEPPNKPPNEGDDLSGSRFDSMIHWRRGLVSLAGVKDWEPLDQTEVSLFAEPSRSFQAPCRSDAVVTGTRSVRDPGSSPCSAAEPPGRRD
jgi:hypothetical protein